MKGRSDFEANEQASTSKRALSPEQIKMVEKLVEDTAWVICDDCYTHQKNHQCDQAHEDAMDCYGYLAKQILSQPGLYLHITYPDQPYRQTVIELSKAIKELEK